MNKNEIVPLAETRFLSLFDYRYAPGKHYYIASRHSADRLSCVREKGSIGICTPDAVTIIPILISRDNDTPRLLLQKEYRYPVADYLLSPPAGLIDTDDFEAGEPACIAAARRELSEETGIKTSPDDIFHIVNDGVFSSPGMTDESNALVCAVIHTTESTVLSQQGATGGELFDGFVLLTEEDAGRILRQGHDDEGNSYSVYTWCALMYFVSGIWQH